MSSRLAPIPISPRPLQSLTSGVQRLAFWVAVVLPLAYIPILSSPVEKSELLALTALIGVHVVCLLAGHDYSP